MRRTSTWLSLGVMAWGVMAGFGLSSALGQALVWQAPMQLRSGAAAAYDVGRRELVVTSGGGGAPAIPITDSWRLNGNEWAKVSDWGPAVWRAACFYDERRGSIIMFGGATSQYGVFSDATREWDGAAWRPIGVQGPPARQGAVAVYDSLRGRGVLYGGDVYNDTWEWDGAQWTQVATTGPGARLNPAMAFDSAHGQTVLFGGFEPGTGEGIGETWAWDGSAWTQVADSGPPGRSGAAMAYDTERGRVVLFGGLAGSRLGDTWEWDGAAWTRVLPTGPKPTARIQASMMYAPDLHGIVLYGGSDGAGPINDAWLWNGTSWSQLCSGLYSKMRYASVAFDSVHSIAILFGGSDADSNLPSGVTMGWDGHWTQLATTGPSARSYAAMAFDPVRGKTLLFGGAGFPHSSNDSWEWDGASWTLVQATGDPGAPPARNGHAMAFDPGRARIVMFGGNTSCSSCGDTWEWDGMQWQSVPSPASPAGVFGPAMAYNPERGVMVLCTFGDAGNSDTWERTGTTWVRQSANAPAGLASLAYDPDLHKMVGSVPFGTDGFVDTFTWNGTVWERISRGIGPLPYPNSTYYDETRRALMAPYTYGTGGPWGPMSNAAAPWEMRLVARPVITTQPQNAVACGEVRLSVAVAELPATFLWSHNGFPMLDQTGCEVVLMNAGADDLGAYACEISNAGGTVHSATAWVVSPIDFDGDGSPGTDRDIEAFFACIAGDCCATCGGPDFNGDGDVGTDQDIDAFFRALAGGAC